MRKPNEHSWGSWMIGALVWLFACAVRIWTQRFAHYGLDWPRDKVSLVHAAVGIILSGTALAGLPLIAWRRLRGRPFPNEPGEWLWTASALFSAAWTAFYVASTRTPNWWLQLAAAGTALIGPLVLLYGASRLKECTHWPNGLRLIAAIRTVHVFASLIPIASQIEWRLTLCLPWLANGLVFASGGVLIFLIADDTADRRRPWSHWIGVALGLSSVILESLVLLDSHTHLTRTSIGP